MSTGNFFRVLYFQQIAELSNIFQNHTGGMIFLKIVANLTVLEGNFYRDFFCKIEGDFNFMVYLFVWSDSFFKTKLKRFFFLFENIDLSS